MTSTTPSQSSTLSTTNAGFTFKLRKLTAAQNPSLHFEQFISAIPTCDLNNRSAQVARYIYRTLTKSITSIFDFNLLDASSIETNDQPAKRSTTTLENNQDTTSTCLNDELLEKDSGIEEDATMGDWIITITGLFPNAMTDFGAIHPTHGGEDHDGSVAQCSHSDCCLMIRRTGT